MFGSGVSRYSWNWQMYEHKSSCFEPVTVRGVTWGVTCVWYHVGSMRLSLGLRRLLHEQLLIPMNGAKPVLRSKYLGICWPNTPNSTFTLLLRLKTGSQWQIDKFYHILYLFRVSQNYRLRYYGRLYMLIFVWTVCRNYDRLTDNLTFKWNDVVNYRLIRSFKE
jgi:hypothetical protein